MSLNAASIDRYNGIAASSATGLPNDFRDPGLFGFHVGLSQLLYSATLRSEELNACLAGKALKAGRREQWWRAELRQDLMLPPNACAVCPDACAGSYGFLHPAPDGLIDCSVVQDSVLSPNITLDECVKVIRGTDGKSFFHFAINPFSLDFPTYQKSYSGNTVKHIEAWLHLAVFEAEYVRRFMSPISRLNPNALAKVQEAFLHCQSVPSVLSFVQLLGEITQSPVCRRPATVTDVLLPDEHRPATVVTTDGTYWGGEFVVPTVSVGREIIPGDSLFDGFEFAELSHQRPSWAGSLRVPGGVIGVSTVPYLDLSLGDVPVIVESPSRVTFDVGEHSEAYWDYLYSRPAPLPAELRAAIVGKSSVSPYEFFRKQRLLYGGVAVQLRGETLDQSASVVPLLRQLIPPQRLLLLTISGRVPSVLQKRIPPCCII